MVKRVGWKDGEGKFYTRYTIPYDPKSGIENVRRVRRGGGEFRIRDGGSRKDVEFPFQNVHGSDASVHKIREGVSLRRARKKRSFSPVIRNPKVSIVRGE